MSFDNAGSGIALDKIKTTLCAGKEFLNFLDARCLLKFNL
jgi:hypothetical protein